MAAKIKVSFTEGQLEMLCQSVDLATDVFRVNDEDTCLDEQEIADLRSVSTLIHRKVGCIV